MGTLFNARQRVWLLSLFGLSLLSACQPEAGASPEDTVRSFLQHLSQQNIEAARQLCTPAKQAYLNAWESLLEDSLSAPGHTTIEVLSLQCRIKGDTAYCTSQEKDAYETYTATYQLLRHNSQWLIDQPQEQGATQLNQSQEVWPADSIAPAAPTQKK